MIDRPVTLPTPLNTLVTKSLELCELMLPVCDVFYPFAAIYENGRIGCIFADETGKTAHGLNGPFTPASRSEITATHVYFDLGDRINRFDRKTCEKTSAAGIWADRATLGYN